MLTIRQTETGWELCRDGVALTVDVDGQPTSTFGRYEDVVAVLSTMLAATFAALAVMPDTATSEDATASDGLLPDPWESPADGGVAFCAPTGDGRDFSACDWSWRDPATCFVPLMLQTETDYGHFGATLAGFVTEFFGGGNDTVGARGRFFDSEAGVQFRDMMLGGRRFTVSCDPGPVTWEDECLEVDDDGWCSSWRTNFLTYQIIGLTGTPFAGFEGAAIQLADPATIAASGAVHTDCGCGSTCASCSSPPPPAPELSTRAAAPRTVARPDGFTRRSRMASSTPDPVVAAAQRVATVSTGVDLLAPPAAWFPGSEGPGFLMPTPLTITNQGRILGHVAVWNTCHTGHLDRCVTPPRGCDMLDFLVGSVVTDEGDTIRTGVLTWRMDHPEDELGYFETIAAYNAAAANSDAGWGDVVAGEDQFGPWVSGALRPGITPGDVRILRALSLSGDWRHSRRAGRYELLGVLAVNYPGYPITAAARTLGITSPRPRHGLATITAAGMVPQAARREPADDLAARLAVLERRFADDARARLNSLRREVAVEALRG